MLRRKQLNSYYHDPYLYAIWLESGANQEEVEEPWFYGYDPFYGDEPRSLRLAAADHGYASPRRTSPCGFRCRTRWRRVPRPDAAAR